MSFIIAFNNFMWGGVLAVILLGTGLLYTITLKVPQIRCAKHIAASLKSTLRSDDGSVSGFAALCGAVGGQVGTGSLVGVASALVAGGPGALFWMWITAVFGMVLSFSEATLGQLFHEKDKNGNFYGGAPYYMTKGLGCRPLAIAYALTTVFAIGICIAMLQNNSIAASVIGVADIPAWLPGIIVTAVAAVIILGGVKRITDAASLIVTFMAVGYLAITVIIVVTHITEVPAMFETILQSAFSMEAAGGGAVGYTIKEAVRNGVARGLFSNDAGNGAAAFMHASAKVLHPANKGFSAMFGTFLTTIVICTCTGFAILLTGGLGTGQDGVNLVQFAFADILGAFGSYFVVLVTFLFCFTTLLADLFYGEVGIRYLFKGKGDSVNGVVRGYQVLALILVMVGAVLPLTTLWNLVDFSVAFLVFFNVYTLLRMRKYVQYVLKDYTMQVAKGKQPVWDYAVDIKERCR
ncbi:alanine/glycine:cation symporter family protein [Megasphaera stantonii]|uniref:Alanine:cation symporter family protein n=1 Tax=Megasphaera stantonii TaxID=2144175 RepID=A0A346B101_9FIRM|nr:alanine/glycine:cation symporter family protein [Megasphaera stantonii]AXL21794.1 alanine:cation symporter family protein [Megasphaera stantonii]